MTGFEKVNVHDNKIVNDHVNVIVNVNNHNIINDCEHVLDFENNPMNEGDQMGYANRGKAFEQLICLSNHQYKSKGWGLIDQVPTPTKNINGRIVYDKKSTVDFYGVSHGRAIAFDAKSTRISTRFDLKNVHDHQVEYLKKFQDQGGVAFLLIHFEKRQETYFVPLKFFLKYWDAAKKGGPKSIPYEDFLVGCPLVRTSRGIALDYLKYCV